MSEYGLQAYQRELLAHHGYTKAIAVHGQVGWSDLGLWTRTAEKHGAVAFVRPDSECYAFVLLEDGTLVEGCFHLFEDNTFSLA